MSSVSSYTEEDAITTLKYIENLKTDDLYKNMLNQTMKSIGAGSYQHQYVHNFSKIDRFGIKHIMPNTEYSGVTFITRPRLNLSSPVLRANRFLSTLDTTYPISSGFMVRSLLDTYSSKWNSTWVEAISTSPLLDSRNPFLTPLTNNLVGITGFPSHSVETQTLEGGYFGEDYTLAIGSDENKKSFDLQLSFIDPQGGVLNYLFQIWLTFQALLCSGDVMAYIPNINARTLCYTVSIYRFLLDSTRRYITRAAKCTGCFPISRPSGSAFDVSPNEIYVQAARDLSITFKCNHFMDNDPIIFRCFNTLVKRYWPALSEVVDSDNPITPTHATIKRAGNTPEYNYMGIPYVIDGSTTGKPPELCFYYTDEDDKKEDYDSSITTSVAMIKALKQSVYTSSSNTKLNVQDQINWI